MSLLSWLPLAPRKSTRGQTPQSAQGSSDASPDDDSRPEVRWVPVIDRDSCIGCERCVNACEHGCLEMIWSFATLTQPRNCTGEGHCTEACPQQIIQMAWVTVSNDSEGDE